jgi:acyl dehydratase
MTAAFDYHTLKNWNFPVREHTYTEKDTILYALGAGFSASPMDPRALDFVYERNLKVMPTMSAVLGYPGFWMQAPESGVDWVQVVHGEQNVTIHQPLPAAATVLGRSRVLSVTDKGEGRGALVVFETQVSERDSGTLLATVSQVVFCRGNGGYSLSGQPSDVLQSPKVVFPDRAPDHVCDLPTRDDMALVYRLSGDMNPLHADPEVARAAGFERPILHGLATFAVAGHAVIKACCDYQPERLKVINARFSAPVYPGETIRTEIWDNGDSLSFRSSVVEREVVVLSNGYVERT